MANNKRRNGNTVAACGDLLQLSVPDGIRTQRTYHFENPSQTSRGNSVQWLKAPAVFDSNLALQLGIEPIPRVQIVYPGFTTCQLTTGDPNVTRAKISLINTCKNHAPNRHNLIQLNPSTRTFRPLVP